jgi:hypothetical protein
MAKGKIMMRIRGKFVPSYNSTANRGIPIMKKRIPFVINPK